MVEGDAARLAGWGGWLLSLEGSGESRQVGWDAEARAKQFLHSTACAAMVEDGEWGHVYLESGG